MRLFAFRNGEEFQVGAGNGRLPEGARYAVMLAETPGLPGPSKETAGQLSVLAAEFTEGRWQWMHLCPETKQEVGTMLADQALAIPGRWHELIVFPVIPRIKAPK